jgi:hypothetical protein
MMNNEIMKIKSERVNFGGGVERESLKIRSLLAEI